MYIHHGWLAEMRGKIHIGGEKLIRSGEEPVVYVVSDSVGETAEVVVRAAASQYNSGSIKIERIPYVDDSDAIDEVMERAKRTSSCIIVYTIIVPQLRQYLDERARELGIITVDIMGPTMQALSSVFQQEPKLEPGLVHKLDEDYFRKIEAIEFAVKYDDGRDSRGLLRADVVLIGVSRVSKTPVSMYLAHRRFKVANVPLIPEVPLPEELFRLDPSRLVGLTLRADKLHEIRTERLKAMGLSAGSNYAELERIREELSYAQRIFRELGCPVLDVSNSAVEETASRVMDILKRGEHDGNRR